MSDRAAGKRDVPGDGRSAEPPAEAVPRARTPTEAKDQVPTLNVANLLTLSRLVLVPVFVLALFAGDGHDVWWRSVATALFAIASLTDQVDGWVARRYDLITDFGKIA